MVTTLNIPRHIDAPDRRFLHKVVGVLEYCDNEIRVSDLSCRMNMSKATLYRRMKSLTGLSPTDFIKKVRLQKACDVLAGQTVSVTETAFITGFSDPKYFARCFKREFGLTPSQYKRGSVAI